MVAVPFGRGAYQRTFAGEPEIRMLNRFFETNPTNLSDQQALLARPGTTRLVIVGTGLLRGLKSQSGAFQSDLFVVSGNALYRVRASDETAHLISGEVLGTEDPSITFVVGAGYERLFIADGLLLQYYSGGSRAKATLTLTPSSPPDIGDEVVVIAGTYFAWSATVNAGTPNGSIGNPFLSLIGSDDEESLLNFSKLINFSGIRGTTYSTTVGGPSPIVTAINVGATSLDIQAKSEFTDGNLITSVADNDLAFDTITLTGGGTHALQGVPVPDGAGIVSLATIASHVLAVKSNSQRFFWIEPGETTIDALNFAEAESEPDRIISALAVGDQVWLVGQSTTEAWYATGVLDTPFAPIKGRVFARGVVPGTALKFKDSVVLVGDDRIVYKIGPGMDRISNHGIEERIRTQLRNEAGL